MRNTIILTMILLASFSCKQKKPDNQVSDSAQPVVVELSITGMSCMGCVETVRSSIAQLDGIDTVSVSLDKAIAQVTFKPQKTDTVSIRKAVELNGYKVTGTKKIAEMR
ncbi:MAG: heavy-metal-associated domain-containing protein [Bacteroidales bacterium]